MSRRRRLATAGALASVALVAVVAAGCGGDKATKTPPARTDQTVKATGYTFAAPAGWRVTRTVRGTSVTGTGSQLVSVASYRLVKRYTPARFEAAARELDGVAANLAAGRKGKVTSKETVTVAGRQVRSYRIDYARDGESLTQQVTFVLRDTTEWLLVCRRAVTDPDEPCAQLLSSFTLKAA